MFDFPASPTVGQTYKPVGGPSFKWSGVSWTAEMVGVPVNVYVADSAPVNPAVGQLWWDSDSGVLCIWYADGDSSQWVQVSGQTSSAPSLRPPTAEARSRIVNGAMQISQENGYSATAGYAADQWFVTAATTGTVTAQRVASVTPNGSRDRYRLTVTGADAALAAGDVLNAALQYIEGIRVADFGWGTAQAKQVVLRFGWKSPAGTYSVAIANSASSRTYIANFTVAAGQANTDTTQTLVIPGDTTGTWLTDTNTGVTLIFVAATGTTYQGVAGWNAGTMRGTSANTNGLATAGAVFELFDVGLYLDPLSTGLAPPWQMPDEAQELQACQRYWCKQYCSAICGGAGTYAMTPVYFPVTMRTTPSMSNISPGSISNGAQIASESVSGPTAGLLQLNAVGTAHANIIHRLNAYNARM